MSAPVEHKAEQLDTYLRQLRRFLQPVGETPDEVLDRALERMVQLVIECSADLGDLWLQSKTLPLGGSATAVFRSLEEAGLLDDKTARRLRRHVSARNRIVHDYDRVTPPQVREHAEALAEDAAELLRRVVADVNQNRG